MLKTVVITGATSGLGYETARKVAADLDFSVILACRNLQKGEEAASRIRAETGNTHVTVRQVDLASLQSVREFAGSFRDDPENKIYCLVCNAGIGPTQAGETVDGFELVFQTNYLANFLLINLLLPCMEPDGKIFLVSSDMHNPPGGLVWMEPAELAHFTDRSRYAYSKLAGLYLVYELTRLLSASGRELRVDAFNPGFMNTGFDSRHEVQPENIRITMPRRVGDLESSSAALADLVTSAHFPTASGLYYDRSTQAVPSSKLSYDEQNARELWAASRLLAELADGEGL